MALFPLQRRSFRETLETVRRLDGVLSAAIDAIVTIDKASRVVLFNPAAERMFGLAADQAVGRPVARLFAAEGNPPEGPGNKALFVEGARGNHSLIMLTGVGAGGRTFPIEATISPPSADAEGLRTMILRDISEREFGEEALRESQLRLEGIVNSLSNALITIDERQEIIVFNPAAETMFGVSAPGVIGAHVQRFIPQRFRSLHAQHIRQFEASGVSHGPMGAPGAARGLRANGEEFPLEASISQLTVGGTKIATAVLRDLSEEQAAEEARIRLAHEIDHRAKNALALVQAVVSLTRATTNEAFTEAVRGRVAALGRAHGLLAKSGWEGANLTELLTEEAAACHRSGRIEVRGPSVLLAPAAVQPISLVVHELATNAIKYGALSTDVGRVQVTITTLADDRLELRWEETGGPTISEPESRGFGSTMIGQVTTRQLGGELDVRWETAGLRLVATWPAAIYRPSPSVPRPPRPETHSVSLAPAAPGKILVVEDETMIAMDVCNVLGSAGWTVVGPAATIEEAERLIESNPDLSAAILDVNVAGRLVYPIADALKARGIPFLFCTGYAELSHEGRFDGYRVIRKPVPARVLTAEVGRLRPAA